LKIKLTGTSFILLITLLNTAFAKNQLDNNTALQQPVQNLVGNWQGFMYCTNINYNFDLSISVNQANKINARFTSKLHNYFDGKKSGGSVYPKRLDINLIGEFSENQSFFILQSTTNQREKKLSLKGILDPTASRFSAEVEMAYYGKCSLAIAGKKDFKKTLKRIDEVSRFVPKLLGRPKGTDQCDGPMNEWLKATEFLTSFSSRNHRDPSVIDRDKFTAFEMLQDQHFKPYFGKGFLSISEKEMSNFYHQIVNGCSHNLRSSSSKHRVMLKISQLAQNSNQLTRSELAMYPYTKKILSNWKKAAAHKLTLVTAREQQQLSATAAAMLRPLWPSQKGNLEDEILSTLQNASGDKMLDELNRRLNERPMTFQKLAAITQYETTKVPVQNIRSETIKPTRQITTQSSRQQRQEARQNRRASQIAKRVELNAGVSSKSQQQAEQLISQTINQFSVEAAKTFSASITSPAAVRENLSALGNGKYQSFLKFLENGKAQQINEVFAMRKTDLLNQYLLNEESEYKNLPQHELNLASLQAYNRFELELTNRYDSLLLESKFLKFNLQRKKHRALLLDKNRSSISQIFSSASSLYQLDENHKSVLLDKDSRLPAAQKVTALYKQNRKRVAPFLDYPGGKYLDAVYRGDFASIKAQDKSNAREISEQFDKTMRSLAPGTRNPYSLRSLENRMTLIKPLAAVYLFNYQSTSKRCLKPDHVVFVVTKTTPDVITTNALGWEISRSYGFTTESNYKINKNFTQLFRTVGNSEPTSVSAGIVDSFLGSGQKSSVINGIKSIMRDHPCDSDSIKQFESNLKEYAMSVL